MNFQWATEKVSIFFRPSTILYFLNWNFCVSCLYVFFSNNNKVNVIISIFIFINQNVRIVPIKDDSKSRKTVINRSTFWAYSFGHSFWGNMLWIEAPPHLFVFFALVYIQLDSFVQLDLRIIHYGKKILSCNFVVSLS